MEESNKNKLDEIINETLDALETDPLNEGLIDKLSTLCRISIDDYAGASKAYAEEQKVDADIELRKHELALREAELKQAKSDAKWHRGIKIASVGLPFITSILMIHADRVGDFIHKIALPWASKFGKD